MGPIEERRGDASKNPEVYYHRRSIDPPNAIRHLHSRVSDCENKVNQLIKDQADLSQKMGDLSKELKLTNKHIESIASIMEAWNNARGFWSTLRFFSGMAKVLMIIAAFFVAIWVFLKTGVWTGGTGGN